MDTNQSIIDILNITWKVIATSDGKCGTFVPILGLLDTDWHCGTLTRLRALYDFLKEVGNVKNCINESFFK